MALCFCLHAGDPARLVHASSRTKHTRKRFGLRVVWELMSWMLHAGGPKFYTVSALTRQGRKIEASRRFNDLVVLHENLKTTFRGCVVPFRPGKTFANSTALRNHRDSFLRDRAYAIKCYLIKITRHPDIKDSTVCTSLCCDVFVVWCLEKKSLHCLAVLASCCITH
jgi:hypothetical protein